jgi:phosphoacetylglucosamine mutase
MYSQFHQGRFTGVMVTASHNLNHDNGAKIADPHGEMMEERWEALANQLANAPEGMALSAKIQDLFGSLLGERITLKPRVIVGRDARTSSDRLRDLVVKGVEALGGQVVDIGLVTTPELHWTTRKINESPTGKIDVSYLESLASSFLQAVENCNIDKPVEICVDCAHGIGSKALSLLAPKISSVLQIKLYNSELDADRLNVQVGAEHVQKTRSKPRGIESAASGSRFASVDGDADRLVLFYLEEGSLQLLDGDKIMALACVYIQDLLKLSGLSDLRVGAVQTAYANGASTSFIEKVARCPVVCVPTGVKHLHHRAAEFDIGLYFEANGHGTILFSKPALSRFREKASLGDKAAKKLVALSELINQAVGDAISDLLLVEAILLQKEMTLKDWGALYTDLPSYQSKVKVRDRSAIKTTNAERTALSPPGLQESVDEAIKCFGGPKGRAFVRPSGTEDVVRVYAEAESEIEARNLGKAIEEVIEKFCS